MKKILKLSALVIVFAAIFSSCSDSNDGGVITPNEETQNFKLVSAPIETITYGDGVGLKTDALADNTGEIKTAYILQFNGTLSESVLVYKEEAVEVREDGSVDIVLNTEDLETKGRVFIMVNIPFETFVNYMEGETTIADVENMIFEFPDLGSTMGYDAPAMVGFVDMYPAIAPAAPIVLDRIVSRVSLTVITDQISPDNTSLEVTSVTLKNVAAIAGLQAPAVGEEYPAAVAANFVDYDAIPATAAVDGIYALYMPANQRGEEAGITTPEEKYIANAPEFSTYVEILGRHKSYNANDEVVEERDIVYTLYLGGNETDDFNIKRNTSYDITVNIKGISKSDNRVTWVDED